MSDCPVLSHSLLFSVTCPLILLFICFLLHFFSSRSLVAAIPCLKYLAAYKNHKFLVLSPCSEVCPPRIVSVANCTESSSTLWPIEGSPFVWGCSCQWVLSEEQRIRIRVGILEYWQDWRENPHLLYFSHSCLLLCHSAWLWRLIPADLSHHAFKSQVGLVKVGPCPRRAPFYLGASKTPRAEYSIVGGKCRNTSQAPVKEETMGECLLLAEP